MHRHAWRVGGVLEGCWRGLKQRLEFGETCVKARNVWKIKNNNIGHGREYSGVTTPGQLWAMPRLPFGLPRLPCPQIDKTFYVTLMLLVSCPGCPSTLVTPMREYTCVRGTNECMQRCASECDGMRKAGCDTAGVNFVWGVEVGLERFSKCWESKDDQANFKSRLCIYIYYMGQLSL